MSDWVRPVGEGSRGEIVANARGDARASNGAAELGAAEKLPLVLPVDATAGVVAAARTASGGVEGDLLFALPVDATVVRAADAEGICLLVALPVDATAGAPMAVALATVLHARATPPEGESGSRAR